MPGKQRYPIRRRRRIMVRATPGRALVSKAMSVYKGNDANSSAQLKLKHVLFIGSDATGVINSQVTASNVTLATNYSTLGSLYDAFAVKAIKVTYIPLNIGAEGLSGTAAPYVRGTTIDFVDTDGTSIPTTVAGAIEYGNAKIKNPRSPFTRYWRIPKRSRPQLNDFATGWNTQNKDVTVCLNSDSNLPVSTNMFVRMTTFYITCYGVR